MQAIAGLGEECTSIMVTIRIYLGDLGDSRCSNMLHPRARWCGGESAVARVVVFRASEAMIHHSVMPDTRTHPN